MDISARINRKIAAITGDSKPPAVALLESLSRSGALPVGDIRPVNGGAIGTFKHPDGSVYEITVASKARSGWQNVIRKPTL